MLLILYAEQLKYWVVVWDHCNTTQEFKLRSILIHTVSFNGNSSLQSWKGKNIDLGEDVKCNFIVDKKSSQLLLKKAVFQKLLKVFKTKVFFKVSDNMSLVFEKY